MAYIRTKDTIFEVVGETDIIYRVKAKGNPDNIYSKSKCNTEVIKQADTIEELCDEFVCGKIHLLLKLYEVKSEDFKEDVKDIVYGAKWTNKGLIYVAKMNKKGELELL